MNSFPHNLKEEIQSLVSQTRLEEKDKWLASMRQTIVDGIVKSTFDNSQWYSYCFDSGRYAWNVELCQELVAREMDVRIYRSKLLTHAKDVQETKEIKKSHWNEIVKYDFLSEDCETLLGTCHSSDMYKFFCKIKL